MARAKFTFDEMIMELDRMGREGDQILREALDEIGEHAAERAKANAPILDGDLRASIHSTGAKIHGKKIDVAIVADSEYAYKQHEELTPAGPMNLGPVSRLQPGTPEGGVGGKFVERVVQFHLSRYEQIIQDKFEQERPSNT